MPSLETLILVPCVAVNHHGYRVGYGAGYYDRYLQKYRSSIGKGKVVFICYSKHLFEQDFQDEWDERADCIITEESIRYIG